MKTARIMVAEDEGLVAKDIETTLQSLGYLVPYVASNANEAIAKAEETRPDLILMDIVMPGEKDGVEAAKEIKNRFRIPVIYLTAYADDETLQRAKITEPFGYILKPFEKRELYTQIEMALYKHALERKLKESEEWFSTTLRSIGDAVIATDKKGIIKFLNPVAEALTGWKKSEVLGKELSHIFKIVDEETRVLVEDSDPVTKVLREGTVVNLTNHMILVAKDGTERNIADSGAPIHDERGNIIGVVLVFHDITEQRRVEKALQIQDRAIAASINGIVITDPNQPDNPIIYCNPAFERITGYSREEAIGRNCRFLQGPETDLATRDQIWQAINEKRECQVIIKNYRKDGTPFWNELAISPVWDARGGRVTHFIGIQNDITLRKRMEEELIKVQKLESIGILAGGIAHDFNNLLTSILGNVSLIKMYSNPEDKIYRRFTEVEKACLRAEDLTQQLLIFSKGGAPVKKLTSIKELIRDSASFAPRGSNVRCEIRIEDDLWNVEVDEGQISQVIHNLVINADQAMPEGEMIRVRAENTIVGLGDGLPLKDGKYVKTTVEDKGIGIPQEHLSKIFDPYFTTKQRGSGLGLTTAYSIIKSHDGYIEVESELGVGTKFYIYLPATQEGISERREQERVIGGRGRILVMDDEESIRKVAGEIIKQLGYEVEYAVDGDEAVELYRRAKESNKPFDVVIMDLTIPGGTGGKEAITRLLEIDPRVKAIVSSGYSNDPVMSEFRKYGFRGVVAKPYKIQELSTTLHNIINEE
jgi:PAS domain S-box-containing protein